MVDLSLLKKQVNVDFDDDDIYLEHLLNTALEQVRTAANRTSDELDELGDGEWPLQLQHAALMLASHWYANREAVASVQMHSVPLGFDALVKPWRKLIDNGENN